VYRWSVIRIIGPSMAPALENGQLWLMTPGRIRPGRIVVFTEPGRPELLSVKRVRRGVDADWWLEGDNPAHSTDSRDFGPVPRSMIHGIVRLRVG
jgi:nickel-type superoxide dismutase maturation protease